MLRLLRSEFPAVAIALLAVVVAAGCVSSGGVPSDAEELDAQIEYGQQLVQERARQQQWAEDEQMIQQYEEDKESFESDARNSIVDLGIENDLMDLGEMGGY